MKTHKAYITQNKERFLKELKDLLTIPSISTDPAHHKDTAQAAKFVADALKEAGADNVKVMKTSGHPVVYGEKIVDSTLPTVLTYGHYDVQPPDPLEEWVTPPFEPTVRGGKLYARGATDDKGQMYAHIKALEMMLKTDSLPCNVKFLIEGEEEIGSPNLPKFCKENKKLLKADVVLVSDTSIISPTIPAIDTGLRGLTYLQIKVEGPKGDLHSGLYGGAVDNPLLVLSRMLGSLHDKNGKITVPGLYDNVKTVSKKERAMINKKPFSEKQYKKDIGVPELFGEKGYTTIERTSIRPSLDVHGIWGGYMGEGAKTVLPARGYAKISIRTVPNQNSEEIGKLLKKHLESIAPKTVRVKVEKLEGSGKPYVMPIDCVEYKAAEMAMKDTFGKTPIPVPMGGSIPVVPEFEEILGLKTVLMGFGLETDNLHAPNEHFLLKNYYKAIETIPHFFKRFKELKQK